MGEVVSQWTNIHQDMLNEIAKRIHSYDDYLQLRLVCKQWNFKLPKIPNSKVPWLLLPIEEEDVFHIKETLDTPSLEEKGIHYLTLPDMQHKLIRGSCHGWLIIVSIDEGTIRMLNPLTKVCLDLPPISYLPKVTCDGDECTYYFGPIKCMTGTNYANKVLVWKVVINSAPTNDNDFTAVAIYAGLRLAFYKPSNKTWLELPGIETYPAFQDAIFFEEKIYVIDDDGQLYEFDAKTSAEPVGGIHEATPPSDIVTLGEIYNLKYLIGRDDGSLLMIVRHLNNVKEEEDDELYYETIKFDIYELKKNSKTWSRIVSLGNYVLVIGLNASVQMLAGEFLNSKGNQIYFTDNLVHEQTLDGTNYYHGIGVFNLEDESCQTVLSDVNFSCPPVWLFP